MVTCAVRSTYVTVAAHGSAGTRVQLDVLPAFICG
jgi:hypothetical protein